MFTISFTSLLLKGILSLTVTAPPPEINVPLGSDSSIVLNCTYRLDTNEYIAVVYIKKKAPSGVYNELVKYTNKYTLFTPSGEYLRNRSDIYGIDTGSFNAILIINDVRCEDGGQYQCYIDYICNNKPMKSLLSLLTTTVNIHGNAEKPTFLFHPNSITMEHDMLNLSCSANVGNPQGLLEMWREDKTSQIHESLGNTSAVYRDTESCTSIANLTVTYNLTRRDNGARFKCSSRNKYSKEPFPAIEIGPMDIFYSPSKSRIQASFSNSRVLIGDNVNMECTSDGNPNPNYTWKFNLTDLMSGDKYTFSVNNSKLSFTITDFTDSGYYQCVASNYIKGKLFNSSSIVTLTIQEINEEYSPELEKTCNEKNPCSSTESCVVENGRAFCSINIWIVIAIVFIIITFILGMTTLSFILLRRTQRLKTVNNTDEMGMGGYLSPVGEANGSNYEALGQNTVHVYSTMQNRDLSGHGSNYEALGQRIVHEYSTMQNRDLYYEID